MNENDHKILGCDTPECRAVWDRIMAEADAKSAAHMAERRKPLTVGEAILIAYAETMVRILVKPLTVALDTLKRRGAL